MIIGLTGTFASGKDTVADYLVEKYGFDAIGTGDIVREYTKQDNLANTRDSQREISNKLRANNGSEFLVSEAIKRLKGLNKVISGIRDVDEVKFLKNKPNSFLIAVDAPIELRFQRMQARNRGDDPKTLEEFSEKEKKEMGSGLSADRKMQNISYCIKTADFTINNVGSLEELHKKVDGLLNTIRQKS